MADWKERLWLVRNDPLGAFNLGLLPALNSSRAAAALLRSADRLRVRLLMGRLRKAKLGLFGLRDKNEIFLIPVRSTESDCAAPYALTASEFLDWLTSPEVRLTLVSGYERVFERSGVKPPSTQEVRALTFVLHTEPDKLLSDASDVFLSRDRSRYQPAVLEGFDPTAAPSDVVRRRCLIALGARDPELAPILHDVERWCPPYAQGGNIGGDAVAVPAEPRRRSVLFVNPAYYNFWHLADALRKRGWDAVAMGIIDPNSPTSKFYHGFDLNLYESDPERQAARLREAFREVAGRFGMLHFYGVGTLSFFPYNYDTSIDMDRVPWDVLEMKRRGALIGYSLSGCHDLVRPSAFSEWSQMCSKCVWREQPQICSDERMAAWGWKLQQLADLICIETDPPLDFRQTPAVFREPLTWATDPEFWRPELARSVPVPKEWREARAEGEVLIYHSVGNYEARTRGGVNVKGTGSIMAAIERLKREGHPVRLMFRNNVPSLHNRWMLAQADIIVDQLNYGRYGATTREGLMLGRPVIARIDKTEPRGLAPVRCIAETPVVNADETTIYDVLKGLVIDPEARARIGEASRAHALQWWAKDVLAERFERVYDHLRAHGRPPATLDS
jgi:hypothetical protein